MTTQSLMDLGITEPEDRLSLLTASRQLGRVLPSSATLDQLPEYLPVSPPDYEATPDMNEGTHEASLNGEMVLNDGEAESRETSEEVVVDVDGMRTLDPDVTAGPVVNESLRQEDAEVNNATDASSPSTPDASRRTPHPPRVFVAAFNPPWPFRVSGRAVDAGEERGGRGGDGAEENVAPGCVWFSWGGSGAHALEDEQAKERTKIRQALKALPKPSSEEPKKPSTAYILFGSDKRPHVAESPEILAMEKKDRPPAIMKKLGEMWRGIDAKTKEHYEARFETLKNEYSKTLAGYLSNRTPADLQILETRRRLKKRLQPSRSIAKVEKDPLAPKRPVTGYMRFCIDIHGMKKVEGIKEASLKEFSGLSFAEKGKALGEMWKGLPSGVREKYIAAYEADHKRYVKENEVYLKLTNMKEARSLVRKAMKMNLKGRRKPTARSRKKKPTVSKKKKPVAKKSTKKTPSKITAAAAKKKTKTATKTPATVSRKKATAAGKASKTVKKVTRKA
ncbi:hypothetical protein HDU67_009617 [Dinochytrium kinnereticum]|nr:hypothetical protein HDU67_009617 [Dinochytrium kinnereticum]